MDNLKNSNYYFKKQKIFFFLEDVSWANPKYLGFCYKE